MVRLELMRMKINIDNLVSISEANQNFSRVARLVDEKGTAIILRNNAPRYVLIDYSLLRQGNTTADDMDVDIALLKMSCVFIKTHILLMVRKKDC